MKYLMIFSLAFSFNIFAQESENKYEPVSNKAEYFFGTFNKGKDLEDLMDWYDDFADWTDDQGDTWDSMTVAILRPQYSSDLSSHDFMWVNTWPTPTAQFAALENWATDDDAIDLFSDIPITNTAVVDTWQWTVSEPAALEAGMVMYAAYSECYLEEGVTLNNVYDGYVDFAKFDFSTIKLIHHALKFFLIFRISINVFESTLVSPNLDIHFKYFALK